MWYRIKIGDAIGFYGRGVYLKLSNCGRSGWGSNNAGIDWEELKLLNWNSRVLKGIQLESGNGGLFQFGDCFFFFGLIFYSLRLCNRRHDFESMDMFLGVNSVKFFIFYFLELASQLLWLIQLSNEMEAGGAVGVLSVLSPVNVGVFSV